MPSCYELLDELFSYIEDNRDLFEVLLHSQSEGIFLNKLQYLIKTMGLDLMNMIYKDTSRPHYCYF